MAVMGLADYRRQLMALLPPSDVLDISDGSQLHSLIDAMAAEMARVDIRVDDLLRELDPRNAYELLSDWEAELGLPSACAPLATSLGERRNAVYTKLTDRGGQSRQYFIDVAAKLGFVVTIQEFRPFVAGSNAGDVVSNGIPFFVVGSHAGDSLGNGINWRYVWQVNAPASTVRYFSVDSGAGEALATWGNANLECAILDDKPAHTHVNFVYK